MFRHTLEGPDDMTGHVKVGERERDELARGHEKRSVFTVEPLQDPVSISRVRRQTLFQERRRALML